jgi:serine protease Do
LRGGRSADLSSALPRPSGVRKVAVSPSLGKASRASPLPREGRARFGRGITAVDPSAAAAEKGLQRGDLIVSINNQPVTTPAQVVAAVDSARKAGRSSVLMLVKRGTAPEAFVGIDISGK